MYQLNIIQKIAIWVFPLLFAITVHEVAHGWIADKLGDPTAKMLGRLTLNPIKHIDPIGTLLIPIVLLIFSGFRFAFGWAKPVPITWQNLKNPRRDMAIVAIAGPLANLLMAVFWACVSKFGLILGPNKHTFAFVCALMGHAGILINLLLMTLNLIPIPPLDGSRVLASALPPKIAAWLDRIEPFGLIILLVLLFTGFLHYVIVPVVFLFYHLIAFLFGLS